VNVGNGRIYKVNKRTGESWQLAGTTEVAVRSDADAGESLALRMAMEAETLKEWFPTSWERYGNNHTFIKSRIERNL
jgi:hypothetical protein